MSLVFGFAVVFGAASAFTLLTIFRQTKFSVVWASLAFIFWFALAGINLAVFQDYPVFFPLSWLWFVLGVVFEIIGIVISITCMQADREDRDLVL